MNSLVLRTASRFLIALLLLYSVFLLMRGHNYPGGGFVGGLVASGAWALQAISFGPATVRSGPISDPPALIGAGLLVAIVSGIIPAAWGDAFLTGKWTEATFESGRKLALGTPLLFDTGVLLTVLGMALTVLIGMEEEQ